MITNAHSVKFCISKISVTLFYIPIDGILAPWPGHYWYRWSLV